uniref:Uncharacterized protein n=2 Tax=Avena sativa TaxID=4498 RepID=A0ACD5UNA0_AVESA
MSKTRHTSLTPPPAQRTGATPPPADQSAPPATGQRRRSPSRGRSRVWRGRGEIVVQREVVREAGGSCGASLVFPMLKRGEYTNWAMVMEVNMQAAALWDAIEDDAVPRCEDKQALATLLRSTPPEMHPMLIGKGSAMAAWEAIRLQHQGNDRVRDMRVRRLRTEFETITFKEGERIEEFGLRITTLAATLRSLGDRCNDEKVVLKFLSVVPSRLMQIAFSMETMMNPTTLTVEEVVGHLRAVEERLDAEETGASSGGQLLLTERQREERKRQGRPSGAGGSAGHRDRGNGSGAKKAGQVQQKSTPVPGAGGDAERDKCRYCGKKVSPAGDGPRSQDAGPPSPPQPTTPSQSVDKDDAGLAGFVSPPPEAEDEHLDAADEPAAPHRYRRVLDLIDPDAENPGQAERLLLTPSGEPATLAEAEGDVAWRQAMCDELASIEENWSWTLTDLPPGKRPIGVKWVYKLKRDAAGNILKHKARLVAKGYVQRPGIDFDEVFAPVARLDSVRLLLAVAAQHRWEVHHMDVKTAFLNGEMGEEVYVCQPPGFINTDNSSKVLRLHKALYRLRQAPCAWNTKLDAVLLSLGFTQSASEHAVYVPGETNTRLLLGVYVDDLVVAGACTDAIVSFKHEMCERFKMTDLGLLTLYLGIEVSQAPGEITLKQSAFAAKLLEKAGMADCNRVHVPMEPRLKLSKESTNPPADITLYRSIIGSLRYLVHTRPDISFSVGMLSRFMEAPTSEHLSAVKHLLRYIADTIDHGCLYTSTPDGASLFGFSDADMAGDIDDRKSTSGTLFFYDNCPVSWKSQKQKVVSLSSCESEYIAAATAACQGVWLGRLLGDLLGAPPLVAKLNVDNKSAIQLCKNPVFHDRSKHIEVRYHFIRSCIENGTVTVQHIGTEDQLADALTKALGRVRLQKLREKIKIVEVK